MVGRVRHVELPLLRARPDQAGYSAHVTADGRRAYVSQQVLRDLSDLERHEAPNETAGLLFGGFFSDGQSVCTIVSKLITPLPGDVDGTRSSVTITASGAERMLRQAAREDPVLVPVGWAHTHPSFEAYFSPTDHNEQRAWQNSGSVGLVMSGLPHARPRYRIFVGPESAETERELLPDRVSPPVVAQERIAIERGRAERAADRVAQAAERPAPPALNHEPETQRTRSPRRSPGWRWTALQRAIASKVAHDLRRDALQPVVVTRLAACVLVVVLLASLAISLYAVRWAHDTGFARRAPVPSARAASGFGTDGVNPRADLLSGTELRRLK